MDSAQKKFFLYTALMLVSFLLLQRWNQFMAPSQTQAPQSIERSATGQQNHSQTVGGQQQYSANQSNIVIPSNGAQTTYLENDKVKLGFNVKTGEIVDARLSKYAVSLKEKNTPIQLFNTDPEKFYFAESGLLDSNRKIEPIQYEVSQITDSKVVLEGKLKDLTVIKTMKLNNGDYVAHVVYDIKNNGSTPWSGELFQQITRKLEAKKSASFFHAISTYEGTSISDPNGKRYQKVTYKDLKNDAFTSEAKGGWLAIQQHYFLSAWLLNDKNNYNYYGTYQGDETYTIGAMTKPFTIDANSSRQYASRLYVGPEILKELRAAAPALDLTVDFGWLWWFAQPILYTLIFLHKYIGNWGWSIIAVTFLIKLLFYRLSAKSYYSMANMRKLQPKMEALKERFGNDKEKLGRATMELYQKEKINPFSGCLPMLVQIPVFISLYYVLLESVQLRQASFMFWLQDLSVPDPFYILPVLMGLVMFGQQKMSPPPPDPTQAKMMMIFPVMFAVIGLNFSAGLALYMLTNSILSIMQQWYITKSYERAHA